MDENTRRERKNSQRRKRVARGRQDLVMIEYIQLKYEDIYNEAVEFYNAIKEKHPTKFDLRKTHEFKVFITGTAREMKKPSPPVENMTTTPDFPHPPVLRRVKAGNSTYEDTLQLEIPLLPVKPKTPTHTTEVMEEDMSFHTTPISTPTHTTEVMEEDMSFHTTPISTPTHTTEVMEEDMSLQEITAQFVQEEDMMQPSLYDELDSELIKKIIDDLRDEPYLKDIFTDIEQQVEYELGMNIDLEQDYRLENELKLL